ncbi:MAG: hypothetical protein ACK5L7_03835 [Paludibacteraceae bacterium]
MSNLVTDNGYYFQGQIYKKGFVVKNGFLIRNSGRVVSIEKINTVINNKLFISLKNGVIVKNILPLMCQKCKIMTDKNFFCFFKFKKECDVSTYRQ